MVIALGLTALVLVPALFGDTNYSKDAPPQNGAPDIPRLFLRAAARLRSSTRMSPLPTTCCDTLLNRDQWPSLPTGQATRQDLLLFLQSIASND